jgi:hypothetical protein
MPDTSEVTSSELRQLYTAKFPKTALARAIAEYIWELVGVQPSVYSSPALGYVFWVKQDATEIMKPIEWSQVQFSWKTESSNDSQFDKAA